MRMQKKASIRRAFMLAQVSRPYSSRRAARSGFTLIELLLVMVILAILAAVIVPKFTGRTEQAKISAAKADVSSLKLALEAFETDNGRYPTSEEGLQALVSNPGN